MKSHHNLKYAIREICAGSGVINLMTISISTVIFYSILVILQNQSTINILIHHEYNLHGNSMRMALESLTYNSLHTILIPIINVVIFMESPFKEQINNTLIRLLPISISVRLSSVIITIIYISVISILLTALIDYALIEYIRTIYYQKLIDLQESEGLLHSQLSSYSILSSNFNFFEFNTLTQKATVIYYTIIYGLVRINLLNIYKNMLSIKSLIIGVVIFFVIQRIYSYLTTNNVLYNIKIIDVETPIHLLITTTTSILLVLSTYYMLKEREG